MQQAILQLLSPRRGHFLMESGHHGDRWLGLELLCRQPRAVEPLASALAERLAPLQVDSICGPLVEGAFVALMVATQLGCAFSYSQRFARPATTGLFPAGYRVPHALRVDLRGKRIAIVNDVINAGSAVKGTFADLTTCGAQVVAIASLLVLGDAAARFAAEKKTALVHLADAQQPLASGNLPPVCCWSSLGGCRRLRGGVSTTAVHEMRLARGNVSWLMPHFDREYFRDVRNLLVRSRPCSVPSFWSFVSDLPLSLWLPRQIPRSAVPGIPARRRTLG